MRFGVVGYPVEHSRSPAIHSAGYRALGIEAHYVLLPTPVGRFPDVVDRLREGALDGVNVTMPHKGAAFDAVDARSPDAQRTMAVNTIVRAGARLIGHNTDVDGVRHAVAVADAGEGPVLVLGSGGAARSAVVALEGRDVTVSGRDIAKTLDVARSTSVTADVIAWGDAVDGALVVNATPIGMHGEELPEPVMGRARALIDMAYGDAQTPAIRTASALGIPYADGLDMLVGQARSAFELFVGQPAPMDVMASAARR